MSLQDRRGVPVSTSNRRALDRYEDAIELFHSYFNDPLAAIDKALAEDSDFVLAHCFRAGLMLSATDKAAEAALKESVAAAEALWNRANERERGHILAGRAWADGRFDRAVELYGAILADYPRDSLALQLAHLGDFYLGQSGQLRDRVARTLWAWDDSVPGYGYVLGMHAFGLEEMGDYPRAEERGRQALGLNPRDPWAIHAVAHVMEMQAPKQGRGVNHLERDLGGPGPDLLIIDGQHPIPFSAVEMVEGEVPPVVKCEAVVMRPVLASPGEPVDAFLQPRLHFHDMGHGVNRPRIARVEGERLAATFFSPQVVAHFLQAEGMHAEHVAIAGDGLVPGPERPRDAVAQLTRLTEIEIAEMGKLKGETVARIVGEDGAIELDRSVEPAIRPGARRQNMAAFALIGPVPQGFRRGDAFLE